MIFYCTDHARFWSLYPVNRKVYKAPARICPTCALVPREEEPKERVVIDEADEYAQYLASVSD